MTYYIFLPEDNQSEYWKDEHVLGTQSFNNFWTATGFKVLLNIAEKNLPLLEKVIIKTDKNKTISVSDFLMDIKGLHVISGH